MLESYNARAHHVSRPIPGLDAVSGWLLENTPPAREPALIHGDIGFSNAFFSVERPRLLVALLDWETATIGDPLLDLGRAILPMRGEGRPHWPTLLHDYRNFPTREELARAYASATGRSVQHLDYYVVLAHFKLAVILERHYATVAAGRDVSGQFRILADYALELLARAEAITRKQA
jgi:aminoglycoside phosphotransferase (APT) family kinase protein